MPAPNGLPSMYGGCFAPALDQETLLHYRQLIRDSTLDERTVDALNKLCDMMESYHAVGVHRELEGVPLKGGIPKIPLKDDHINRMWEVVPWPDEVENLKALFDRIDPVRRKELRDLAHHLLWYAVELSYDRVPVTAEVIKQILPK